MKSRILLISNNPLSKNSNNGVTMTNFLSPFKKKQIINLYFSGESPSENVAHSYYRITDKEVLSFGFLKSIGKEMKASEKTASYQKSKKQNKKSAFKMLIRNFVWKISRWNNKKLKIWLKKFNPSYIVLQIGDCAFAIDIAHQIQKDLCNIPIVIYNSENYYFKDFDYFREKENSGLIYKLFMRQLRKKYCLIGQNSIWFHLTDEINGKYKELFPKTIHITIRNTPTLKPINYKRKENRFNAIYFGNLRMGRLESLLNISKQMKSIIPESKMHIFGNCSRKQLDLIARSQNIVFHGFDNLSNIYAFIKDCCDLVIHAEPFDNFSKIDLIDAFSTKIVDCLSVGIPFLFYSPKELNSFKYLEKYDACFLASDEDSLARALKQIKSENNKFPKLLKNSIELLKKNHNKTINNELVKSIISF